MPTLSHLDEQGRARMVDVSVKAPTLRQATAGAQIRMRRETAALIVAGQMPKGDVFQVARIAGIMAAKKTGDLIPLCHPLELTDVDLSFAVDAREGTVSVEATVKTIGRTGVEMEALTAVSVAALTIYDMCKAVDRGMVVGEVMLLHKRGGKSGEYRRDGAGKGSDGE
jgi:cyclic pyranopterin phosphate synthase